MWKPAVCLACLVLMSLASASAATDKCPETTAVADPAQIGIAKAETAFGEALLAKLRAAAPHGAVLISPLSVSTALALAGQGAQGATRSEFENVLALSGNALTLDALAGQQSERRRLLTPCGGTRFDMANSIWAAQSLPLDRAFLKKQETLFDAAVRSVDFAKPQTLSLINGWVSRQTNGKIPSILQRTDPDTRMVLVNALYFKGQWKNKFDAKLTASMSFTLANGSAVRVPGMHRKGNMQYGENASFQAVVLPFTDPDYEMLIALPRPGTADGVPANGWIGALPSQYFNDVRLTLPRMHLNWDASLKPVLVAMGMAASFSDSADFSGWTPESLKVGDVIHKTAFDADEEGAEGAAATAVVMTRAAVSPRQRTYDMVVDRPYYVLVRHRMTGTVVFMGYVADPGTRK